MKKITKYALISFPFIILGLLSSCVTVPKGVKPVDSFKVDKYLGKWYEIARLDMRFERNLNNVTAEYSLKKDGTIKVDNQGYDVVKGKWKQSIGKAKFLNDKNQGSLKVSFFGPFYAGYNVVAVDANYQYALVAGSSEKYMWILSRTTTIPDNIKEDYLKIAQSMGYKTDDLVWVSHIKVEK